jgi:hypothetical protein
MSGVIGLVPTTRFHRVAVLLERIGIIRPLSR